MFPQKIFCTHYFVSPPLCFMLRPSSYFSDGHKNGTTGFSCNGLNQNARMSPKQHRGETNLCGLSRLAGCQRAVGTNLGTEVGWSDDNRKPPV
jgi:hypothetical protein